MLFYRDYPKSAYPRRSIFAQRLIIPLVIKQRPKTSPSIVSCSNFLTFDSYIRIGMMQQLRRLKIGKNIEEAHMRNRQLIASWAFAKGAEENVIEKRLREGKTY
ncbi:MAG: hypothetical protein QNK36_10220 [Colwellia sp.]|nr:hypothetical protein [Colwellia sp.]